MTGSVWFDWEASLRMEMTWEHVEPPDVNLSAGSAMLDVSTQSEISHDIHFYMVNAELRKKGHSSRGGDSQWVSVCGFRDTWTPLVKGQFGCGGHRTCDLCLYGLTTYWAAGGPPGNQEEKTWRFTGEVQIFSRFQPEGRWTSDSKPKRHLLYKFYF